MQCQESPSQALALEAVRPGLDVAVVLGQVLQALPLFNCVFLFSSSPISKLTLWLLMPAMLASLMAMAGMSWGETRLDHVDGVGRQEPLGTACGWGELVGGGTFPKVQSTGWEQRSALEMSGVRFFWAPGRDPRWQLAEGPQLRVGPAWRFMLVFFCGQDTCKRATAGEMGGEEWLLTAPWAQRELSQNWGNCRASSKAETQLG